MGSNSRLRVINPKVQGGDGEPQPYAQIVPRILVVDDDPLICEQLARLYAQNGYGVVTVSSAEEALRRLQRGDIDLVVADVRLRGMSGIELTKQIETNWPDVPVIVITGYADIGTAVEVLKLGASDFIVKPFSVGAIQESTRAVLQKGQLFAEIRHFRRHLKDQCEFGGMVSKTAEMHRVFETIRMVSATDMTVVIEGETGTGKELVATTIHYESQRSKGPFVSINCAGIPETLLESELFGYERGAFTGADVTRPGKIEVAHRGTLFLDEIESMSLPMQANLLRVLETRKVQRLGGNRKIDVDIRVIAASNIPLKELLEKGQMRNDFYYRINVIPIYLIPLRRRREDIPLLVSDFLRHHPVAVMKGITVIAEPAMRCLLGYSWPGNVRELQNVLERAIVMTRSEAIEKVDLPEVAPPPRLDLGEALSQSLALREWLRAQEKRYLLQQLETFDGKISLTAKNSGLDVKTLYRKMRFHGLDKRHFQRRGPRSVLVPSGE